MRRSKAFLALSLAACSTYTTTRRPPEQLLRNGDPPRIRVTTRSGDRMEIFGARIEGDSIVGLSHAAQYPESRRVAVASSDVTRLELLQADAVASLLAIAVFAVAIVVITGAVASSGQQAAQTGCQPASIVQPA
jgi:hypothetical protein